jgi:transcriptional regulator with XRE-family HTH domain
MSNLGAIKLRAFRQHGGGAAHPDPKTGPGQARKALNQADIAAMVGVTAGMISFLETGAKQPSLRLASRLEHIGVCAATDWTRPARCGACARLLEQAQEEGCSSRICEYRALVGAPVEQAA